MTQRRAEVDPVEPAERLLPPSPLQLRSDALSAAEEAVALFRDGATGPAGQLTLASALARLGRLYMEAGRVDDAASAVAEAVERYQALADGGDDKARSALTAARQQLASIPAARVEHQLDAQSESHMAAEQVRPASRLAPADPGKLAEAAAALRSVVLLAERAGAVDDAAIVRTSLAGVLTAMGRHAEALAQVDRISADASERVSAAALMQRAVILQRLGRKADALAAYRTLLPRLRRQDDRLGEARLLHNRGLLHVDRGAWTQADTDLRQAAAIFRELGQEIPAAMVEQALSLVDVRRGDPLTALARLNDAEAVYREHGLPVGDLLLERGRILLSVGLVDEVLTMTDAAAAKFRAEGRPRLLAETLLLRAEAALAAGDPGTCRDAASQAARTFARQRRKEGAVLARYLVLRSYEQEPVLTASVRRQALRTAGELQDLGWRSHELDARIIAARVALERGDLAVAQRELAETSATRSRGPVEARIRAWYAEALLRQAAGRPAKAEAALRAGFRLAERRQLPFTGTELGVGLDSRLAALTEMGVALGHASGSPARVLHWAERHRNRGLVRHRPPAEDDELAAALADLRHVMAEEQEALLAGRSPAGLRRLRVDREQRIRHLAERTRAAQFEPAPLATLDELAASLGEHVLIELVPDGEQMLAVVLNDGTASLVQLGPVQKLVRGLETVLFSLRRYARGLGSPSERIAGDALAATAERLDQALLRPLGPIPAGRPLVIAATGALYSTPWSVLPTCTGRPVTVAPSATAWLRGAQAVADRIGDKRTVLVGGPVPGAAEEIHQLATLYPAATILTGQTATAAAALAALDGSDLAHLAAHSSPRTDNPLFSALLLTDGPIVAYDLERLHQPPRTVVLSSCHSAADPTRSGTETIGLAGTLLALGTQTVIAPVIPMADHLPAQVMLAVHQRLRAGETPAAALATVQRNLNTDDPSWPAAQGLVCYGAH